MTDEERAAEWLYDLKNVADHVNRCVEGAEYELGNGNWNGALEYLRACEDSAGRVKLRQTATRKLKEGSRESA